MTRIAPTRAVAYWITTHSAQFGAQMPTRSPRCDAVGEQRQRARARRAAPSSRRSAGCPPGTTTTRRDRRARRRRRAQRLADRLAPQRESSPCPVRTRASRELPPAPSMAGLQQSGREDRRPSRDAGQHPAARAVPVRLRLDRVADEDGDRGRHRRGRGRSRRDRRRRLRGGGAGVPRPADRRRHPRPERRRGPLRAGRAVLAVGRRAGPPAGVRRHRDGAVGRPRPRREPVAVDAARRRGSHARRADGVLLAAPRRPVGAGRVAARSRWRGTARG